MSRRAIAIDVIGLVLAFIIATAFARQFLMTATASAFFDWELVPSVMLACGHGFTHPVAPGAELTAFVSRKAESFDCAHVAGETREAARTARVERYALYAIAAALRTNGISWRTLDSYFAVLFGLSSALTYGIFRLVSAAPLALAGAVFLAASTKLQALVLYRDYIKEPPFLAVLLVIAILATREQTQRSAWVLSALAGLLLGIGVGWRMDLFVFVPFFLLTAVALVRWAKGHGGLKSRAGAALVFLAGFAVTGYPIVGTMSGGSNSAHVVLLGFMAPFTTRLGLETPAYDVGELYSDGYAYTLIAAQARVREHDLGPFPFGERVYDEAGGRLVADIVRHFPADMVARAYGAVVESLAYPFTPAAIRQSRASTVTPDRPWLRRIAILRAAVAEALADRGVWITIAAIVIIAAIDLRLGLFTVIAVAYFCGYSMLQYNRRHTFHLDLFSVAAVLFLAQVTVSGLVAFTRDARLRTPVFAIAVRAALRGAGFAIAVVLAAALVLLVARWYQQPHVAALIDAALQQAQPIPFAATPRESGTVLVASPQLGVRSGSGPTGDVRDVRMDYVVATFDAAHCPAGPTDVRLQYTGVVPTFDKEFNRTLRADASGRVLAPVFYEFGPYWTRFDGFVLDESRASCLTSLARVERPGALPFPFLYAQLGGGWRSGPLYQRFSWEPEGRNP